MKGFSNLVERFNSINIFQLRLKTVSSEEVTETVSRTLLKQVVGALGPLILTVSIGMVSGYSAILLPQLELNNSTSFQIDTVEASWIASLAVLPMAIGSIVGVYFSETFGRKSTHTISSVPLAVGWLSMYFAFNTKLIFFGRFITGLFSGLITTSTGVYIGETSEPKYRGFLLGGIAFAVSLGLLLCHLLGTFLEWQTTALISSVFPVLSLIVLSFVPESPSWLAKHGKIDEAKQSFYWYRGFSADAKNELDIMLQRRDTQDNRQFKDTILQMKQPEFLKPLGIVVVYIIANQWVGVNAITFYTVSIMKNTVGEEINEYLAMIIVDLIRLLMSVIACILLRKCNRRPLAFISAAGTTLSLFIVGIFVLLTKSYPDLSQHSYISMIGLISYISFISIGFVPLPWALIGELFPLNSRSIGSGITSLMAFLAFFSVVKTSPSMFEYLGTSGTFFVFSFVAFLGTFFVYFCVPETKGKLLHEIEDSFKHGKLGQIK